MVVRPWSYYHTFLQHYNIIYILTTSCQDRQCFTLTCSHSILHKSFHHSRVKSKSAKATGLQRRTRWLRALWLAQRPTTRRPAFLLVTWNSCLFIRRLGNQFLLERLENIDINLCYEDIFLLTSSICRNKRIRKLVALVSKFPGCVL